MPEAQKEAPDLKQLSFKVPPMVYSWLDLSSYEKRAAQADLKASRASEATRHIIEAFKKDPRNKDKIKLLPLEYQ